MATDNRTNWTQTVLWIVLMVGIIGLAAFFVGDFGGGPVTVAN